MVKPNSEEGEKGPLNDSWVSICPYKNDVLLLKMKEKGVHWAQVGVCYTLVVKNYKISHI